MKQMSEIINQMQAPIRESQPQKSAPSRTSEESRLLDSVKEARIIDGDIEDLNKALRYSILKIGIREANLPNEIEFGVLVDHIIQNYGTHTPAEIRLAFDMAISGKLDVDPVCYENFSCLYFSSIMNAYRKWASQAHDHILRERQPYEEKQLGYKVHWGEQINYVYRRMKAGEFVPYTSFPVEFYDQMVEDKFIDGNPYNSDDQKRKIVFLAFQEAIKRGKENLYVNE